MIKTRKGPVHRSAQNKLCELEEKHREMEESLIGVLGQVIQRADTCDTNEIFGQTKHMCRKNIVGTLARIFHEHCVNLTMYILFQSF